MTSAERFQNGRRSVIGSRISTGVDLIQADQKMTILGNSLFIAATIMAVMSDHGCSADCITATEVLQSSTFLQNTLQQSAAVVSDDGVCIPDSPTSQKCVFDFSPFASYHASICNAAGGSYVDHTVGLECNAITVDGVRVSSTVTILRVPDCFGVSCGRNSPQGALGGVVTFIVEPYGVQGWDCGNFYTRIGTNSGSFSSGDGNGGGGNFNNGGGGNFNSKSAAFGMKPKLLVVAMNIMAPFAAMLLALM